MSEDTVESLKAELDKVREALKKANAEAKTFREAKSALELEVEDLKANDPAIWKEKALKAEVRAALREKGITDARALKILDLDGIDLDENGRVTGLDDKIKANKKDWPEIFDPKVRVGNAADIHANGDVKPRMDSTELQVAKLFGNV